MREETGADWRRVVLTASGSSYDHLVFSLCPCSDDDDDAGSLDILMEAPEGFRNSDEECFSESQVNQNENLKPVASLFLTSAPWWL